MSTRRKNRENNEAYHKKIRKARKKIFEYGKKISSRDVTKYLESQSLTPVHVCGQFAYLWDWMLIFHWKSAFSFFEINFFLLLVVDLLHEFELGVWKAIFTYLMCILHAAGGLAIQELNWR